MMHWLRVMFSPQRLLELSAASLTLTGQWLGSTTLAGALCYSVATTLWWWLTICTRMWGLMPLNVASAVVTGWTLWWLCG